MQSVVSAGDDTPGVDTAGEGVVCRATGKATVHSGRTYAAIGSASSAPIASVHTRCREAADARLRIATSAIAAAASSADARTMMSSANGLIACLLRGGA
jgi:hypothetical protein